MGIYIKDMEMPKSCDSCRLMMLTDTNCAPELYCGCPIVFKAHPQGKDHRPDYCPLVPVPPHGRLIDADAFEAHIKNDWKEYDHWIAVEVENRPTIIPASFENPTKNARYSQDNLTGEGE